MSIVGITVTADNGVDRITNDQNITGTGTIDGETVVLDNSASLLRSSSTGSVVVTNSQIKLDSDVSTAQDAGAPINYGTRGVTTTTMAFRNSSIVAGPFTARRNIMVTELTDAEVIESDDTGYLYCYTATDAILNNVRFKGINTWEIYRAPSVSFNVIVDTVNKAYLNWEAGRLDFFGFAVANINEAHAWMGTGAANNASWHWNNDTSFNNELLYLTASTNRYYEGFTVTWKFIDRDTSEIVEDTTVIFRDDYVGGSMTERGRYTTNSGGTMSGTYDSQNRSTGSNIERPTLFVVTNAIVNVDTGSPGSYDYPTTVITGDQGARSYNYDVDAVNSQIEIRSYLHERPTGYESGVSFAVTEEVGSINSDLSISRYQNFILAPDAGISMSAITLVEAYTKLDTLDKLYDRIKAEWYNNDSYPLALNSGNEFDLGSTDLIIDATTGGTYTYSSANDEITISPTAAAPITRVGASGATSAGLADEISISFPTGITIYDVAYLAVGNAESEENTWNTPSGWVIPTGLGEVSTPGTASVPGVSIFRKVLDSDDVSSTGVTITNLGTNTSGIVAQMIVYRNVDILNPEDVLSTTATGSSGDPDPASITTVSNNSKILVFGFMEDGDQSTPTPPSGYSAILDNATLFG